ncbi:MAG: MBL fold metallo-hydrolase RNA specificity domain-containing protein, partial [Vicinamibacteria bacterium]
AVDATGLYSRHVSDPSLDPSAAEDGFGRLIPKNVHFHRSVEESKKLNHLPPPRVIISASGMLTAGRVLHHLKRLLPEARNVVLLVGFQAAGTRGRAMLEGAKTVRVHGMDVPVRAEIESIGGLSGHADRAELLRWAKSAPSAPGRVFVTHGEPPASAAFARLLEGELGCPVEVPELGASFDL